VSALVFFLGEKSNKTKTKTKNKVQAKVSVSIEVKSNFMKTSLF
jgi:hypothetical protein